MNGSSLTCYATRATSAGMPPQLIEECSHMFTEVLGLAKDIQDKIQVRPSVAPVCSKLGSLPFVGRAQVSEELRKLEHQGVIERVQASE